MTGRSKKPKKKRFASGVSEHNLLTFGRVGGLLQITVMKKFKTISALH